MLKSKAEKRHKAWAKQVRRREEKRKRWTPVATNSGWKRGK